MIKLFIVFVLGLFFGAVATCIAVVAGDAERCAECRRKARNDMGVNEVDRWCNACKNYGEVEE